VPRGTFATAGSMVGGHLAGPGGALIGRAAGKGLSKLVGFGDYTVETNSLVKSSVQPDVVPTGFANGKPLVVSHREYVADVVSSGSGFTYTQYVNNPGVSTTFPWLAGLAKKFQRYRFRQLAYVFKTMSSEYASGSALGSVIISTNTNVLDAAFPNKADMENTAGACSAKPSENLMHGIECESSQLNLKYWFTRDDTNVPPAAASLNYDQSVTTVATQGLSAPAGTVIGELWITYTVELSQPILQAVAAPVTSTHGGGYATLSGGGTSSTGPWSIGWLNTSTAPTIVTAGGLSGTFLKYTASYVVDNTTDYTLDQNGKIYCNNVNGGKLVITNELSRSTTAGWSTDPAYVVTVGACSGAAAPTWSNVLDNPTGGGLIKASAWTVTFTSQTSWIKIQMAQGTPNTVVLLNNYVTIGGSSDSA